MRPLQLSTKHGRSPGPLRAFTLIELVAILVIVAIMAGVAVPTLGNITGTRASVAARQLHRDLTHARQRAMATGRTCWVTIDPVAETWTLREDNPTSPGFVNALDINDVATGRPYVTTLQVGDFVGVEILTSNFDGASTVGFNWLGEPLAVSGSPLAANGAASMSAGHQVAVDATSGLVTHATP